MNMLPKSPVNHLHEEIHIKEEPLIKNEFESSTESSNFSTHLESSTIKDLFCEQCKLQFDKKIVYDIHLKIVHKKDTIVPIETRCKPFKCDICEYRCSKKCNMKRHVARVHQGKKPFKCNICDYSISQRSDMNRHVESVHEVKKTIKCDICDYSFSCKSDLIRHVASVHQRNCS